MEHQDRINLRVGLMEEISELARRYNLQEDIEHIIIPSPDKNVRIFLLKRRFMRISYSDGHYVDYPIEEVIEATVRYPELSSGEALYLFHKELDTQISKIFGDEKEVGN